MSTFPEVAEAIQTKREAKRSAAQAHAPAWAWTLQHSKAIDRLARKFTWGTSLDVEDFRQELIADLVDVFPKYDAAKAGPTTWMWMRASKVRRSLTRASVRNAALDIDAMQDGAITGTRLPGRQYPVLPSSHGHADRVEACVEVAGMLERATDAQRVAALTVLRDWPAGQLKRVGLTLQSRQALLQDLR